jgi:G3E family GTPase
MAPFIDARLPLLFGAAGDASTDDALLLEGEGEPTPGRDWFTPAPQTAHPVGCVCCTARNAAGLALSRLLLARARGQGPFFRRVIAVTRTPAGRDAVLEALRGDPLASSCLVHGESAR